MSRTRFVALFAALLLLLAACGDGGGSGGDHKRVTLVLNWTPNAHHLGIYAAKALSVPQEPLNVFLRVRHRF